MKRDILNLNRRDFGRIVMTLGAMGCLEPHFVARALGTADQRLSWRAYRNAEKEGVWSLTDIEGEVPNDLFGTLFRVAPGQTDNHGTTLRHFFDGDAFLSGYSFRDGQVTLRAAFINTPEREQEIEAGRMIYGEFGTLPPAQDPPGRIQFKNQGNVNVIHYDGRLLALSEGGHPTAADPASLSYQGRWDFHGTLPAYVPFTAHPKLDPTTGEAFGYGVAQGPGMALTVFRMQADGRLETIHKVPLGGYYMIHDMLLTTNHLVFVIPPVQIDMATIFSGKVSVAEALRYLEQEPTRFMILMRDGSGTPIVVEQPPNMVFHNGNAREVEGRLVLETLLSPDDGPLELLYSFTKDELPRSTPPQLTRIEIDLASGTVTRRDVLAEGQEFPRFDIRRSGQSCRYLYTMASPEDDPLVATALVRHDLEAGTSTRIEADSGRGLGETIFVQRATGVGEEDGWLMTQGYDSSRDENFLEIRDAGTLDLAARIWTGTHFPLGFHGNFARDVFVSS